MPEQAPEPRDDLRAADLLTVGQLTVRSDRDEDVHSISLAGELDLANAEGLERELRRAVATDAQSILLDLSGLTFIDSTGVRVILSAFARSSTESDRLALVRGPAAVQRVFQLTGVLDRLPFTE